MIFKITFLLACLNILVTAPNTPGESSDANENQQENTVELEELYDVEVVWSLNSMPTLDETEVHFSRSDINLLTEDCDLDLNCLDRKRASVKKYQQKMQAIQCVHGLLALRVLDELQAIFERPSSSDIGAQEDDLRNAILRHLNYLKKMLCLINMAQLDAYAWQIEIFTFVEGLADGGETSFSLYETYFTHNKERMREKPLSFVGQCVQDRYLPSTTAVNSLVKDVYSTIGSLYNGCALDRQEDRYTLENLMLYQLYPKQDFIFEWPMYRHRTDMENFQQQWGEYSMWNDPQNWRLVRALDPIGSNKYNVLISKCIQIRVMYFVWLHLHVYGALKSRPTGVNKEMLQMWNGLVANLKKILRLLRFKGNVYWSAIHIMMDDLNNISQGKLAAQEEYTRKYFCQAVEDLGLDDASGVNQQLIDLKVPEEHDDVYEEIDANSYALMIFIMKLKYSLSPINGSFVRFIVSAEGNEAFCVH
ncbi:uncharacterized protein LOC126838239 [Adelges cooleyi]|uniref:uncharacterized protein LOC126838239 n=1 Tax=Adelges cooleyi TaxID=133065 RepID=UPI00217F37AF|nr:uncharacterized protein LOC126838239 [Adelges cooleyi]